MQFDNWIESVEKKEWKVMHPLSSSLCSSSHPAEVGIGAWVLRRARYATIKRNGVTTVLGKEELRVCRTLLDFAGA